jgi:hypothetical protein
MVERGLRIRVPFQHLLEIEEIPSAQDEELQDDELAFLTEIERLKPYSHA